MKKNCMIGLVVVLIFVALVTSSWAKETADKATLKQAQAFFDAAAAMFDKGDLDGLVKIAVPGTILHYANGKDITIEEWKSFAAKELAGMENMKSKFLVEKAAASGDTIVVHYKEIHTFSRAAGKKYRNTSFWSATLVKMPEGLKAAHFIEFSEKEQLVGKAVKTNRK